MTQNIKKNTNYNHYVFELENLSISTNNKKLIIQLLNQHIIEISEIYPKISKFAENFTKMQQRVFEEKVIIYY